MEQIELIHRGLGQGHLTCAQPLTVLGVPHGSEVDTELRALTDFGPMSTGWFWSGAERVWYSLYGVSSLSDSLVFLDLSLPPQRWARM